MSFYFRTRCFPTTQATPSKPVTWRHDFKYWELMQRASARGVRVSTMAEASRARFLRLQEELGFEPTPLAYEFRLLRRATFRRTIR